MKFYVVDNGTIVNLIMAESKKAAEAITKLKAVNVEDTGVAEAGIGAVYDKETGSYVFLTEE